MSNPFDVSKAADQLEHAAKDGDGLTARRILEEAGLCNIQALVKQTNLLDHNDQFRLSLYDEPQGFNSKFMLYKEGDSTYPIWQSYALVGHPQADNRVVPLASIITAPTDCKE